MSQFATGVALTRALTLLSESHNIGLDAAAEDQAEEIESLENGISIDSMDDNSTTQGQGDGPSKYQKMATETDNLTINLKTTSAGVIRNTTVGLQEARVWQYWLQFKDFTASVGKVKNASDIDNLFLNIPANFPTWIALWIMAK
ncbi:hypothetical protein PAXRUDRAFT_35484 [Paxillus rubicundulus Ve08.2h10]|uniref:Uncharacterized protein n=1 Tax=Paxillus rubicundulus Ve08.2h10 TaxID=930991 RepID=A0A0D0DFB9_9AGAM|nr:hypothetical protein PAXRUDRAFT_35484 [Paxillus rubicundulus Ve08.2h10]